MEHNKQNETDQPPPPPPYRRAPRPITTEEVQSYLDWNKTLMMEIMEKMNLRKLAECAEIQERLQQNLMYLAAIADWVQKPQTPSMSPQLTLPLGTQPEYNMEHPQPVAMPQQQGIFPPNMPWQFDNPQDQLHQQAQEQGVFPPNMPLQFGNPPHQLHQQAQEQLISSIDMLLQFVNPQHEIHQQAQQQGIFVPNNGMHRMHSEAAHGAGSSGGQPSTAGPNDALSGSMQAASEGGDDQGNSTTLHNHSDIDIVSSYLKD